MKLNLIEPMLLQRWILVGAYEQKLENRPSEITFGPIAMKPIFQLGSWYRMELESGSFIWLNKRTDKIAIILILGDAIPW